MSLLVNVRVRAEARGSEPRLKFPRDLKHVVSFDIFQSRYMLSFRLMDLLNLIGVCIKKKW